MSFYVSVCVESNLAFVFFSFLGNFLVFIKLVLGCTASRDCRLWFPA